MARLWGWVWKLIVIGLLFSALITVPFRWVNPPVTAFVLQDEQTIDPYVSSRWTPIEKIAPAMQIAVVAAEDQTFPNHYGFDFDSLKRAISQGGAQGGGSTITQQLTKNLYLWPGRSFVRKGIEAYLTLWIASTWPKQRVLEVYLNIVEFGPGIFGITQASKHFFNKTPEQLTLYEASLLAAVLPSPKAWRVDKPSAFVLSRAKKIRRFIRQLGGPSYLPWQP